MSKDGEEGYPGTVTATAIYTLTNDNELKVEMKATTDKTTIVNMAHHSYWNLGRRRHDQRPRADACSPTSTRPAANPDGKVAVPDGKVKPVKGTPFDFTAAKPIGKDLKAAGGKPVGFDHNWVVNGDAEDAAPRRDAEGSEVGPRADDLAPTSPAMQFYSGNFMDGTTKGKGVTHDQYAGLCLEIAEVSRTRSTSPRGETEVMLKPGQTYKHTMIHKFTTE